MFNLRNFINSLFVNEHVGDETPTCIWKQMFFQHLADHIDVTQHHEALVALNNQRIEFNKHFDLSAREEELLAVLCCKVFKNLIAWDILTVQSLERSMGMVSINRLSTYSIHNVDVATQSHRLKGLLKIMHRSPQDLIVDVTAFDIANQLNHGILKILFHQTKSTTIGFDHESLSTKLHEIEINHKYTPNWFISSLKTYELINPLIEINRYVQRGDMIITHGTMFNGRQVKWIVTDPEVSQSRLMMGISDGENNIIAPMAFVEFLLLQLEGPIMDSDKTIGYKMYSNFCCIESCDRKKMIRQFNVQ